MEVLSGCSGSSFFWYFILILFYFFTTVQSEDRVLALEGVAALAHPNGWGVFGDIFLICIRGSGRLERSAGGAVPLLTDSANGRRLRRGKGTAAPRT